MKLVHDTGPRRDTQKKLVHHDPCRRHPVRGEQINALCEAAHTHNAE
jgi:hypothetical protein